MDAQNARREVQSQPAISRIGTVAAVVAPAAEGATPGALKPDAMKLGGAQPDASTASATSPGQAKPMTTLDRIASIQRVRNGWRAADGETADEIIADAQKAGVVTPVGWDAAYSPETGWRVTLTWLTGRKTEAWTRQSIHWSLDKTASGNPKLMDVTAMNWGAPAFILSVLKDEDGDRIERHFLLSDVATLNFVRLPSVRLGDVLAKADCRVGDDFAMRQYPAGANGAGFSVSFTPKCPTGPARWRIGRGVATFRSNAEGLWQPMNRTALHLVQADDAAGSGNVPAWGAHVARAAHPPRAKVRHVRRWRRHAPPSVEREASAERSWIYPSPEPPPEHLRR
ncbi:MAG TPA: hypothetical protein VL574_17090 [Stellaceae bacterium]|nr:hypothetical protein [Stellaceae bacterium]